MKNLVKKNQLMITALAIMIAIAGYLQFAGSDLEKDILTVRDGAASAVDSGGVITENYTAGILENIMDEDYIFDLSEEDLLQGNASDIESLETDVNVITKDYMETGMKVDEVKPDADEVPGEAVFTSSAGVEILAQAKLLKEQTRARNKETLMNIINSETLSEAQKQEAINSMVNMTAIAEKEAAAEILLEAKGFSGVVVSIEGNSADVVVNAADLTEAQRAQIEDIIMRKADISPENIIISTIVK